MDPLSVTVSILTILGAGGQVAKGVGKIRALNDAPDTLLAMNNEIADIQCLVQEIDDAGRQHEVHGTRFSASVFRALEKVRETLLATEQLIAYELTTIDSMNGLVKLDWKRWLRLEDKIRQLQKRMRSNKIDLSTALVGQNSSMMHRIDQQVQRLYILTETVQSQSTSKDELIISQTQKFDAYMQQQLQREHQSEPSSRGIQDICTQTRRESSRKENGTASTTTFPPPSVEHSIDSALTRGHPRAPSSVTQISLRYARHCTILCNCSCHKQSRLRTPKWANNVLGSLFVGYTGVSPISPGCDVASCQGRSYSVTQITYTFPWWFLSRALAMTIAYCQPDSPELCLRVFRVRPYGADIFYTSRRCLVHSVKKLLFEGRASVLDVTNYSKRTALHWAMMSAMMARRRAVVDILLREGADPSLRDTYGNTPSTLAWTELLEDSNGSNRLTTLHDLFDDRAAMVQFEFPELQKAFLNVSGKDFYTMLLDTQRRDIDQVDSTGRTTLSWAAARGDLDVVQQLLKRGSDPNKADTSGNTPSHHCCTSTACLKALLDAGADAEAKNVDGHTMLVNLIAHSSESISSLELLLARGVDVLLETVSGPPAIYFAVFYNRPKTLSWLLRNGGNVNDRTQRFTLLTYAIFQSSDKALEVLLDIELLDCTEQRLGGGTIVHAAACWADLHILSILRSAGLKGININAENEGGYTALESAKWRRDNNERLDVVLYSPQDDDPLELYKAFEGFYYSIEGTSGSMSAQDGRVHGDTDPDTVVDCQEDEDEDPENEQWEDALESAST